jgi:hypothetical protein
MTETTMKNQEILNALNEKIKAAEEALLYLNQTKAGLERVIENHKTPCEEAHKKVYGHYPDTGIGNGYSYIWWDVFQKGYNAAKEETVSEYQPTPLEKLQESNWYVDAKTLLKSNWEPKPQNEKEVAQGLRNAMKTAKENGVFDEQEPETLTLKNLLKKWEFDFSAKWENPKNRSSELYEEEVERFIQMFEEWMPDVIRDVQDDLDDGYNAYHDTVMENLK